MARSEVRTGDYSFQGMNGGNNYRTKAFAVFCLCIIVTLQITAQFIAYQYGNNAALGWRVDIYGFQIYPFYRAVYWLFELMRVYEKTRSNVAAMSAFVFASGLLMSAFITRVVLFKSRAKAVESLHGSAHWATINEIKQAGLLDSYGNPFPEGVVVGGIRTGKHSYVKMMRHNGKEHILCYAPTRSGKGVSLVLPTLLDGWKQSAFVFDIKGENFALSAGYRKKVLGHKILKLDFTDPAASAKGTSATFNPLEEVPLDYDLPKGFIPDINNLEKIPFEMVRSGTYNETSSIQQIVAIIIDPQGKGLEDHWGKTASALLLGAVTHLLYKFRMEGRGCPGIADVLSELSTPGQKWQEVVQNWQNYPHLGVREELADGAAVMVSVTHPVVLEEAQTILNKPEKEAGSVLSTVVSNLALFRDPIVAHNTSRSSFKIRDLMHNAAPVDLYLVVSPADQLRLTPLTRLVITQIIFTLAGHMEFAGGRSVEGYKHRLLLLLDEFPSLGKLDLFEKALGFIGGYGLKAFIIAQGLPQLFKAYSKDEAIRIGCHIQIAFAPNDMETAEYLSKSTGQMTVIKENCSETTQDGKLFAGKSRNVSLQEVQRPLMTPDECRRLPGLKKDSKGDVTDAGSMLIFPAGFSAIFGTQTLYFKDADMDERSKIQPPQTSDNLRRP
ncbi:conjugal transfer protein TraG [Synergistales bacterium]|nr:conjugal transfer protein TraG [Synergistales bacterium]